MPINSIATTTKFTNELDKMFAQKAVTGFLLDNAFGAKFSGTNIVSIPDIDFVGLADYDRDNGFSRGKMTVGRTTYEMTMDRGRAIQIDREEADESGVAGLAGHVLGEYVRTVVTPECDSYTLSKLFGVSATKSHAAAYDASGSAIEQLITQINNVQAIRGFDEELVAFIDPTMWNALMLGALNKGIIEIKDFKQGDINLQVRHLNGCALIPVAAPRMKTKYKKVTTTKTDSTSITTTVTPSSGTATATSSVTVNDYTKGGLVQDTDGVTIGEDTAKSVRCLVMPKKAASLVKKSVKMRIWTPNQNLDADAYKFDYRIYYDAFVKKSQADGIYSLFATT